MAPPLTAKRHDTFAFHVLLGAFACLSLPCDFSPRTALLSSLLALSCASDDNTNNNNSNNHNNNSNNNNNNTNILWCLLLAVLYTAKASASTTVGTQRA